METTADVGSERENLVVSVVNKNVLEVLEKPELTPLELTREKTLKDLGADSIQVVEILTSCMRELKVKVPRSETAQIKTLGNLVDCFLKYGS